MDQAPGTCALPNLTKQYKPVFTLLAVAKVLEVQLIESYDPATNLSKPDNVMVSKERSPPHVPPGSSLFETRRS